MKRINHSSRLIEAFVKAGLVAAIAAALLVPTTVKVQGSESATRVEHAWPMLKRASWDALPLPPIPYLETMPWLVREPAPESFKIDRLLGPKFEMMRQNVAGTAEPSLPQLLGGRALNGHGNG
jgi:hypothetical protein